MAIYLVPFPGVESFEDDERVWNMDPLFTQSSEIPMFWLGGEHKKAGANPKSFEVRTGHCFTYQSPFYQVSREQLWKELHEWKGGLHRLFANGKRMAKYGRPGRYVPSLRVNCLIQVASILNRNGAIAFMHEDSDHAEMIARCVEWVHHIIYEVGDYTKHERNMK